MTGDISVVSMIDYIDSHSLFCRLVLTIGKNFNSELMGTFMPKQRM